MSNDIRRRPEGALLRTYLSAAGVSPESFAKPLIGIATASSQVFSENPDAKDLGTAVVKAVGSAGGIAVRWDTVRTPELMAWGHAEAYSFAWRDQLADLVESWTRQEALDGLILVGDAPETLVGMTMAAARLNVPAVCVPVPSDRWEYAAGGDTGKKSTFSDPYELLSESLFGKKTNESSEMLTKCLLAKDNHEANAIYFALEALGVCLPGASTASPKSKKIFELAEAAADRVVALVKAGHPLRRVITVNSLTNAIRLNAALGGSLDVAVHLIALAHETGCSLSLDDFDRVARETPQLTNIGGVADKQPVRLEEFDAAGGVWAVMSALKDQVAPSPTIVGKGALELARTSSVKQTQVIATNRPLKKKSGVGILKGNLAPAGALFLLNQVPTELLSFKGSAVVFDQEVEAAAAVNKGQIKKGEVIVIRQQGPKGGPGLRKLRILPALLESRGLNKSFAVITDGRLPDTPSGLFVSCAAPEAAVRGPLAVVRNGDVIEISIEERRISIRLTELDLQVRQARWQAPEVAKKGFLGRYSRSVSEASEGAVLK